MNIAYIDNTRERIDQHPDADQCWLWCQFCERFFQYKNALPLGQRAHDKCPFRDCVGRGVGVDLLWWDDMREPDDPRWPAGVDELHHGMPSPEMESFYKAKLTQQIEATLDRLTASPEWAATGYSHAPQYLSTFFRMMSANCWDLLGKHAARIFEPELARMVVCDLPVWSEAIDPSDAQDMASELRALFTHADRVAAIPCAGAWLHFVRTAPLADLFRQTIRDDPRLRQARARARKRTKHAARDRRRGMRPERSRARARRRKG